MTNRARSCDLSVTEISTAIDIVYGLPVAVVATQNSDRVAELARVLADPVRMQLLDALRECGGELCQCELAPRVDVGQPTLSHHLHTLVDAGLISVERRGRWAYYAFEPDALEPLRSWLGPDR